MSIVPRNLAPSGAASPARCSTREVSPTELRKSRACIVQTNKPPPWECHSSPNLGSLWGWQGGARWRSLRALRGRVALLTRWPGAVVAWGVGAQIVSHSTLMDR